jgi:GAF domain-containing protein
MTTTDEINPEEYRSMECALNLPSDPLAQQRLALLDKYDFLAVPGSEFDAIAQRFVAEFGGVIDFAGVNRLDDQRHQIFTGAALLGEDGHVDRTSPGMDVRTMTPVQGACSTLISRPGLKGRTALAMSDLMDFPLFATNDMVTVLGKRTYLGAQIIAPEGVPIGTVWGVGPNPHEWKQPDLEFAKGLAREAMSVLLRRQGL